MPLFFSNATVRRNRPERNLLSDCRSRALDESMRSPASGQLMFLSGLIKNKRLKINPCVIPNSLEDLGRFLYRNPPELCLLCVPEPSGTSSAICTGTRRNFVCYVYRNPPEPCLLSAPEPSGTSSAICTRTRRNLISHLRRNHLHRNPPELCLLCVPESSGTLSAICTGTFWNLVSHLHQNPPEPH